MCIFKEICISLKNIALDHPDGLVATVASGGVFVNMNGLKLTCRKKLLPEIVASLIGCLKTQEDYN